MNLRYNMNAYPIIFYEKVSFMTSSYPSLLVSCYASEFLFLWPGCTIHLELVIPLIISRTVFVHYIVVSDMFNCDGS